MTEQKEKAAQTAVTVKRQGVSNDTYVTANRIPEKLPICKNKFQTVDAETLLTSPLKPINFIVEDFLSQGIHILAGAPKIGKSWLALWLCIKVSLGETVWNFKTKQGTVLYLCLEDNQNRIQNRLLDIADWNDEKNLSKLHFTNQADLIGDNLENQIENFCNEHSDIKLIVIDTLQKIRTISSDNAYANDYRDLTILKTLADKFKIAILLIHHLRKQNDSDPFNRISGTTGISGAADSNLVLIKDKRSGRKATLHCVGRDISQRELELEFDNNTWKLLADSVEQPELFMDEVIIFLSEAMKSIGTFEGTATDLIEKVNLKNITPSVLAKKIIKCSDELEKLGVLFESRRSGQRREIVLIYDGNDANDGKMDISNLPSQPSLVSQTK